MINISMLMQYKTANTRLLTMTFSIGMLIALFIKNNKLKFVEVITCLILFLVINLKYPLNIGQVEEAYFFLPIMILCLTPGKLYSNFVSFLIVFIYYNSLAIKDLAEMIEDSTELILINLLISVLLLFYIKFTAKMNQYKRDSYTDYLTGISNRKAFTEHLDILAKGSNNHQQVFSLLLLDLDGFKKINDTMGHDIGDKLLIELSRRLKKLESEFISFYRVGGDEFAFIILNDDDKYVYNTACNITSLINLDYSVENSLIKLQSSLGIVTYPRDAQTRVELIKNCDLALNRAKNLHTKEIERYDKKMSEELQKEYELEINLKDALKEDELFLVYQPKIDIRTGKIAGAEALLRWNHKKYGLIPPDHFIRLAEKNGSIIEIGQWVIDQVLKQLERWSNLGFRHVVAINISVVQLLNDDLCDFLEKKLEQYNIESKYLEIEITETALMDRPEEIIAELSRIKGLGVNVAIDDFGVEYSSFNYLRKLPIDILKIDREFIKNCEKNGKDKMILNGIIKLGHNLNLRLVAEGVELSEQRDVVIAADCDYIQGFIYSKPLKIKEYNKLLLDDVTYPIE